MLPEKIKEVRQFSCKGIHRRALSVSGRSKSVQQSACRTYGSNQPLMYDRVIGFEQIETDNQTLFQSSKLREVCLIFDSVMVVEVLKEVVQPRDEGSLKCLVVDLPLAKCFYDARNFAALMTKGGVH